MKPVLFIVAFFAAEILVRSEEPNQESVDALVKKLGSAKFTTREQAHKVLLNRPDAEKALRAALPHSEAETRRRIEDIIRQIDCRPLRELREHVNAGRMNEIIKIVADWPEGRCEDELWATLTGLVGKLYDLHLTNSGTKEFPNPVAEVMGQIPLPVVKAVCVTDSTEAEMGLRYFIRAREIKLGYELPAKNQFDRNSVPVVSGVADFFRSRVPRIVFAGKGVIVRDPLKFVTIVSGGDVVIEESVTFSLIIARGSVIQTKVRPGAGENHIIAGKKVILPGRNFNNLVVENEPNPLGYIRWSDAPKVEPKKK